MKNNDSKKELIKNDLLTVKYELIAHLILKYNLELDVICNLTPSEFANYIDNDIKDDVARYINKNGDRIKETKFFFYGKTGGASSRASIVAGLRKNLTAEVFNSLKVASIGEKDKFIKSNPSINDIKDYLVNMVKD